MKLRIDAELRYSSMDDNLEWVFECLHITQISSTFINFFFDVCVLFINIDVFGVRFYVLGTKVESRISHKIVKT